MNKFLSIVLTLMGFCAAAVAQNPIIRDQFSADPTARVFNGKVFVFPSHDIPAPDDFARKDWFCMADYHVFSSENLTDWTDHGMIIDQKNVEWVSGNSYSMWAPDCVEKDCRYYFLFPANVKQGMGFGFGVGVAEADKPEGPYTPRTKPIEGVNGIDPCLMKGGDGNWYLYWGGGTINCARLNDDFTGIHPDEKVEEVEFRGRKMKRVGTDVSKDLPEGFKEGPFAFYRNGKYYLTYPWVRGKAGEPGPDGKPSDNHTETLAYAMSDSPYGPFEYKGLIMKEHYNGCWTNHHSIVEYNGQWYLFYHHNDYSPNFDKNRSVCCDSLFFNEDGTIQEVTPTLRGVGLANARSLIQIDRYSSLSPLTPSPEGEGAISYLDTQNYFAGWAITYKGNAFSTFSKIDFGKQEATTISVRAKAPQGATLLVKDLSAQLPRRWGNREIPKEFLEQMMANLGKVASIDIPASDDFQVITLPINQSPRGVADLQFSSKDGRELTVDWVGFDVTHTVIPSDEAKYAHLYDLHPALAKKKDLKPWKKGGMETGKYRNLFAELGYTDEQIDAKLGELFDALFNGPDKIYFELGDDKAIVSDVKNHDARTEGMSYGMMIAVQLDRKDVFDRLWRWAKEYMQMKEGGQKGYFAWSVRPDGSNPARGAAADGELYFITSLIFASNRWGNDTGIDYLKEAQYILDACMGKDGQPRLFDEATKLICFTPGQGYTDPSYHIPAFYEVWAKYAQDGRSDYWMECARASREYLHKSIHPVTGLNEDYNNFDGSSMTANRFMGNGFRYDSWRVPMNIALDYSWSCADREWQTAYGNKLQNFFYSQGLETFVDQYNMDGTAITDTLSAGGFKELRHTPGLIATTAALSLVCTHAKAREFVDHFWTNRHEPFPSGYFDAYYEGILRLFAAMHLSGRYRVIEPTVATSPAELTPAKKVKANKANKTTKNTK